ncbi:MAG: hypothetical protein JRN39_00115 [Nitrososphaerota archaeon]|nr:hypothetical protein [Nitrososphaerota archaeon]
MKDAREPSALAAELASLLGCDRAVLEAYVSMLQREGPVPPGDIDAAGGVLERMKDYGLVIRSGQGYLPVHPRLGISNLYRIGVAKDQAVKGGRVRIDAITAYFVRMREDSTEQL